MKSPSFLCSKNTLFGMMIGFALASVLAFKIMSDPPNCAISLDKMNVFYTGLDNPITIVARGVPLEQLTVQGGRRYRGKRARRPLHCSRYHAGECQHYRVRRGFVPQKVHLPHQAFPRPGFVFGGNPKNKGCLLGNGGVQGARWFFGDHRTDIYGTCTMVSYQVTYSAKAKTR